MTAMSRSSAEAYNSAVKHYHLAMPNWLLMIPYIALSFSAIYFDRVLLCFVAAVSALVLNNYADKEIKKGQRELDEAWKLLKKEKERKWLRY